MVTATGIKIRRRGHSTPSEKLRGPVLALLLATTLPFGPLSAQEVQLKDLPPAIANEVTDIRKSCGEVDPEGNKETFDDMQGVYRVRLGNDRNWSYIIDNRFVCNTPIKGANCHTYGCDVRIYRQNARGGLDKVFDHPISGTMFVSISTNNTLNMAAFHVTPKYSALCHGKPNMPECDYLLRWSNGRFMYQRIK